MWKGTIHRMEQCIDLYLTEIRGSVIMAGPGIVTDSWSSAERILDELIDDGETPVNTYLIGILKMEWEVED